MQGAAVVWSGFYGPQNGAAQMTTLADIRRRICCPSGTCISPRDCYADDASRSQLVDIHHAARAVQALLLQAWREYPRNDGPMVRSRTYGEEG